MDFVKRNIGLLAFAVLSLGAAAFLAVQIRIAIAAASASRAEVAKQREFIDTVKKGQLSLTPDNLQIAKDNRALADQQVGDLRKWLHEKFSIPTEVRTEVDCVRLLKNDCLQMRKMLIEKDVEVAQGCLYFSFNEEAASLPHKTQVPVILKQLRITREVMRLIGRCNIMQLVDYKRPYGLDAVAKDQYSIIPFSITVGGDMRSIQRFVNVLQRESRYFLVVRDISIEGEDQARDGNIPAANVPADEGEGGAASSGSGSPDGMSGMSSDGMGMGMMMVEGVPMMMGGPDGGGARATRMTRSQGNRPAGSSSASSDSTGATGDRRPAVALPDRDAQVVFQPHLVQATIRFDFVEFPKPQEK